MTMLITKEAEAHRHFTVVAKGVTEALPPPTGVSGDALTLFSVLGIPLAMIVSAISGPLDDAFGGGNLSAFVMGAIFAAMSGVLSIVLLPTPQPQDLAKATTLGGGFH
ncbi:hypothetical protein TanjilG_30912 [Lupinus angustifolius]|uniref:Uncharacterized protein n=1 Tax=Lupinus angustifolius TaxID=3871 RepID=A0A1J7GLY5_LUPAN|nr:hypothetical protein TanjilG_30912 [Lupinus angustifolius]